MISIFIPHDGVNQLPKVVNKSLISSVLFSHFFISNISSTHQVTDSHSETTLLDDFKELLNAVYWGVCLWILQ